MALNSSSESPQVVQIICGLGPTNERETAGDSCPLAARRTVNNDNALAHLPLHGRAHYKAPNSSFRKRRLNNLVLDNPSRHQNEARILVDRRDGKVFSRDPSPCAELTQLPRQAIAHELSESLVTLRVSNIYELSTRILLFKFAKPDVKKQFVVDAGFRCHLTEYARTTAGDPSGFVRQLRKLLNKRRVTGVRQIGTDRVIEFSFSEGQYRMYLEFFAVGQWPTFVPELSES